MMVEMTEYEERLGPYSPEEANALEALHSLSFSIFVTSF